MVNLNAAESSHGHVSKEHHSSFFQPFVRDKNSINLRIPPPFVKNFRNIPSEISLKDMNGLVWPAKLSYIDDQLHISSGWKEFVKEHSLKSGDFVVFHYVPADTTFFVMAFDSDGCNKVAPLVKKKRRTIAPPTLLFERTIQNPHKNFLTFPSWVIKKCGVELPQMVELSFEEGVSTMTCLRGAKDRAILGYTGIDRFFEMNNVQKGDKLQFQIILGKGKTIKNIIARRLPQ